MTGARKKRKPPIPCPECLVGDRWRTPDGAEVRVCQPHALEIGLFRRHDGHWQVRTGWSRVHPVHPADDEKRSTG